MSINVPIAIVSIVVRQVSAAFARNLQRDHRPGIAHWPAAPA